MLSDLVIGYLFLGGAGAGLLALLGLSELAWQIPALPCLRFSPELRRLAWVACAACLAFAAAMLAVDLGRFERMLYLFALPTASPLTIGAFALAASLVLAICFAVRSFASDLGLRVGGLGPVRAPGSWAAAARVQGTAPWTQGAYMAQMAHAPHATQVAHAPHATQVTHAPHATRASHAPFAARTGSPAVLAAGAAGVVLGAVLMLYTGLMLSDMPSVLAWNTPLVPVLFCLSSLSCGCALLFACAAFAASRTSALASVAGLVRFDTALVLAEALVLAAYLAWCLANASTHAAGLALLQGALAPWFWVPLVGVGLVAPVVLERLVSRSNYQTQFAWIAGCVLCGGFALRWCVVGLAQFDPSMVYSLLPMAAAA